MFEVQQSSKVAGNYVSWQITKSASAIQFENKALKDLFSQLPMGIALLSNRAELLYKNGPADEFFADYMRTTTGGNSREALLSTIAVKRCQRIEIECAKNVYRIVTSEFPVPAGLMRSSAPTYLVSIQKILASTGNIGNEAYKYGLSKREMEIAALILDGYTNKEIAHELYLSIHTVNKHTENLLKKTGANNRVAAVCKIFNTVPRDSKSETA